MDDRPPGLGSLVGDLIREMRADELVRHEAVLRRLTVLELQVCRVATELSELRRDIDRRKAKEL